MTSVRQINLTNWVRATDGVKLGHSIELGRELFAGMPHYPTHPDFELALFRKHGERVRRDGASSASCRWSFGGHTGTHMDALCHVSHCGLMFDGAPVDNERLERGEAAGDATQLPPYVGRGILLDVAAFRDLECLPGDHVIGADELESTCHHQGIEILPGDVALIRTGWGRHWGSETYLAEETPGPDLQGGRWLADKGVTLVGSDTSVFEKGPVAEAAPVHRLMLMERRIPIMENLELEALARTRTHTFLFLALPLRVRGATASPVRPIALC